jgi:hypothetical protein
MERERLGTVVVAVGVVLLVGTLVGTAATAPDIGTDGGDDGDERRTLVGVQSASGNWHKDGNVHMLEGKAEVWRSDTAESYFDVTMLDDGTVMAGFMDGGQQDCGPYEPPCARTGFHVIDPDGAADGSPAVVDGYSFPVRSRTNSEVHDVERLDEGRFLLSGMDRERIFVVEDGAVVWQWNASSFYEAPPDPTRRDWLHINDVDVIEEGRYLVSVRNANQLVVVERGEGVVEVVNEDTDDGDDDSCTKRRQLYDADGDGDVRCGDPDVLDHQHNPQWLDDGAVLVADSDNDRVVELHRTDDGDWAVAWTLERANGVALNWPRDADRLPDGNTLVTDTRNSRLLEVDENGTVVWSTRTHVIPYEAERLPAGERPEGVRYGSVSGEVEPNDGGVPVLTPAVGLLRGALPMIPFWFGELQLALAALGLVLSVGGGALRRSGGDGLESDDAGDAGDA